MKKIKLLVILTGGLFKDGITLSQYDILKNIDKNIFDIDIMSVLNTNLDIINKFKNVKCNVIEMPNRKKNILKYIYEFNKLIKKKKYDIIHVHGSSSLMVIELRIAKKNKVPVRIAHCRNTMTDHKIIDKIFRPIFNYSYNVAFACGQDAGKWLFGKRNYIVFHNGKDLFKYKFDKITRDKIRKKYKLGKKITFGTVGNLNEQKNQIFLINTFYEYYKQNHNSILFIIGEGHKINELKNTAKELNIYNSVIFTGSIDNVNEMLQAMDIMLLPSLYEGLPNAVLEWQAAGLPCIISDTVTTECKVYDEVYYLPINEGIDKWVNCIESIENRHIDREKLSKLGCEKLIENGFEIKENTKRLEKIYIELLNKFKKE